MRGRPRAAAIAARSTKTPRLAIRDAASLLIVDTSGGPHRVLMGRRHENQVFLPGKWVFPGGRLDADDTALARCLSGAAPGGFDKLGLQLRGKPSALQSGVLVRSLALAAIRETFEETGLMIAAQTGSGGLEREPPPVWADFLSSGLLPAIERLQFFARAITPPGRTRRYDTRFFLCDAQAVCERRAPSDDEFAETGWFTVPEIRALETASVTRWIIDDASRTIETGNGATDVPFYRTIGGKFTRTTLDQYPIKRDRDQNSVRPDDALD